LTFWRFTNRIIIIIIIIINLWWELHQMSQQIFENSFTGEKT